MKVHDRIRTARERAGISLREFARRVDVSPTHLLRLESGEQTPSEEHLGAICAVLDLDFDALSMSLGRVPVDVQKHITKTPGLLQRLRREMTAA